MNNRIVLLHIICWGVFVLYEFILVYYSLQKFQAGTLLRYLVYYIVNISIFYSHLFVLNFAFNRGGGYIKGFLLFLLQLLLFMLVKAGLDILFGPPVHSYSAIIAIANTYLFLNTYRCIYFCGFATFYWIMKNIAGYRKKAALSERNQLIALKDKAELEQRLSESRNAYLQQQLNPHLLFNSLSFIYSSVYAHSADASRCVLLLSDIMRYSLDSNAGDGKTALAAELEQIGNLIDLNRYRFEEELCLETRFEAGPPNLQIIPLVLFTLTENLFKHGHLTDPANPALLKISADSEGLLRYYSRNRKTKKSTVAPKGGLGLQNTRIRLSYNYGNSYQLEVTEDEHIFELLLTLKL